MWRRLFRSWLRTILVVAAILALVAPLAIVYSGIYDVAATRQHTPPMYWMLMTTLRHSIRAHAAREAPRPPDLSPPALADEGLVLYEQHCALCHGAPGQAPEPLGLGLTPPPPNLIVAGRDGTPGELYWAVAKGLKMTGMPAWEFRFSEHELWAVVAWMKAMPTMSPVDYEERRDRLMAGPFSLEEQP